MTSSSAPLLSTRSYDLYRDRPYNFRLVIHSPLAYQIFKSLSQPPIVSNILFDDANIIHFVAENVCNLSQFIAEHRMNEYIAIRLIQTLGRQLHTLYENGFAFVGFNVNDVLVLNRLTPTDTNYSFLCMIVNTTWMCPVEKYTMLPSPIQLSFLPTFVSHQLLATAKYQIRCSRIAFAKLVVFCLFEHHLSECTILPDVEAWLQCRQCPLFETKLGGLLLRYIRHGVIILV